MKVTAAGCCFLAAKVEESFRNPEEIAKNYFVVKNIREVDAAQVKVGLSCSLDSRI